MKIKKLYTQLLAEICLLCILFVSICGLIKFKEQVCLENELEYAIEKQYSIYLNGELVEYNSVDLDYMTKSTSYNVLVNNETKSVLITERKVAYRSDSILLW